MKLRQIMQTILTLGNALNQGTARGTDILHEIRGVLLMLIVEQEVLFFLDIPGSAVGFRLDSLLKLSDTRARNNKMTLMHYLCKVCSLYYTTFLQIKLTELLSNLYDLDHRVVGSFKF